MSDGAALNETATIWELYAWLKTLHCYESDDNTLAYLPYGKLSNGKDDGAFTLRHQWFYRMALSGWVADSIIPGGIFQQGAIEEQNLLSLVEHEKVLEEPPGGPAPAQGVFSRCGGKNARKYTELELTRFRGLFKGWAVTSAHRASFCV